jgi:hypothetical protein
MLVLERHLRCRTVVCSSTPPVDRSARTEDKAKRASKNQWPKR